MKSAVQTIDSSTQQTVIMSENRGVRVAPRKWKGSIRNVKLENNSSMVDRRRTRSQGPLSSSEGAGLLQWDSLQNPVRIEREHAEARRLAREANMVININERMVESSEIPQVTNRQSQYTTEAPQLGEISPKHQDHEGHAHDTTESGEIPPIQTDKSNFPLTKSNMNEISPKEPNKVTDLVLMEEGARVQTPDK